MRLMAVGSSDTQEATLLSQMHAMRARVFGGRLGWDVDVRKGEERDEFDDLDPTYLLVVDPAGRTVMGSARLLPAAGTTMLEWTFPYLLDGKPMPRARSYLESSRFCVDTSALPRVGNRGVHDATTLLMSGIIEHAVRNGHSQVVTVTDLRLERLLGRVGIQFQRLGAPRRVGNTIAVAGSIATSLDLAMAIRATNRALPPSSTKAA